LVMAQAGWPSFDSLPWPYGAPPAAAPRLPDGARWPRIRLVTPCLNPGPWLEETILSVAAQGYPLVEHVIVDGGSTDGTAAILARHHHRLAAVILGRDGGPAEAIAKGISGSTADLLGWLNADDMLAPGALYRLAAAWCADPEADIVHGDAIAHRDRRLVALQRPLANGPEDFTVAGLADVFGRLARGAFFLTPELLFTRRLWERLGGRLDASLRACFDYEFWLRAAAAGARPVSTSWPAAFYRLHAGQISGGRARVAREQAAVRARFHCRGAPLIRPGRP
ncbi:glycosyltransferase family 2 protein, partial [Neoroseomonas rubea]|uniref:glycosyltransferase family 2 protein n=1 Tax=Neoroseomonas rubea TaxID=2748666 RepID=UPI0018DF362A